MDGQEVVGRLNARALLTSTLALRIFLASASAPDYVWATASAVSFAFIGSEHVMTTLPDRSPVCFNTSATRDQCTASNIASAWRAASRGVPARACAFAFRASRFNFRSRRE